MTVQSEVYTRLSQAAAVTALVQLSRITPQLQSELSTPIPDQFPAITFGSISANPLNSVDGFSGLTQYRIQIDAWVREDYDLALEIAQEVRDAIIGSNSITFAAIWIDQREFYEQDIKVHNVQLDFHVWYRE